MEMEPRLDKYLSRVDDVMTKDAIRALLDAAFSDDDLTLGELRELCVILADDCFDLNHTDLTLGLWIEFSPLKDNFEMEV